MRHRRDWVWALGVLALLLAGLPPAARAVSIATRSPLVALDSEGIAAVHFDVFLCDVCDTTSQIYQLKHISVFADRSVVFSLTRRNLDGSTGTTTTVASGTGSQAAFDDLLRALDEARFEGQHPDCAVEIVRNLEPPRPDSILTERTRDQYTLHAFGDSGRIDRLSLGSKAPTLCRQEIRGAVVAVLDYAERATRGSLPPQTGVAVTLPPLVELAGEGTAKLSIKLLFDASPLVEPMFALRNLTIFTDGSVASVLTRSIDQATTRVATGRGTEAAFATLRGKLDAAGFPAWRGGDCFVTRNRSLPPSHDGVTQGVREATKDSYVIHSVDAAGGIQKLDLDPKARKACPGPLRQAVLAILDYVESATGGPLQPPL